MVSPTALSLYLVILAFFLVLITISHQQEARIFATVGSLGATFRADTRPLVTAPIADPDILARTVEEAVLETLPDVAFAADRQGRVLAVHLPLDALFLPGRPEPSAERRALVAALAAILADPSAAWGLETVLVLPRAGQGGAAERLAIARAGALARALVIAGAPARLVAAGFERTGAALPGAGGDTDAGGVMFRFRPAGDMAGPGFGPEASGP